MRVERILAIAADDGPDARPDLVAAFRIFIAMHATAHTWLWAVAEEAPEEHAIRAGYSALVTAAAGLSVMRGGFRRGVAALFALVVAKLAWTHPTTSNHYFLEVAFLGLLVLFDTERDDRERALFLQGARWVVAIVLFYTGFQKVLYGTYFEGQYLALEVATGGERFAGFFGWIDPDEVARLSALGPMRPGAGPFRFESPLLLAASNAVWITEMGLAPLLLWRRTRRLAWPAAAVFVCTLQLGAREIVFAALFANAVLLFAAWPLNRKLLWLWPLPYAFVIGSEIGLFPGEGFN